jgi:hypothetical protein
LLLRGAACRLRLSLDLIGLGLELIDQPRQLYDRRVCRI